MAVFLLSSFSCEGRAARAHEGSAFICSLFSPWHLSYLGKRRNVNAFLLLSTLYNDGLLPPSSPAESSLCDDLVNSRIQWIREGDHTRVVLYA